MDQALLDNIVVLFAIVYYAFLCIVYLIRAFGNDKLELALAPAFSVLLGPFAILWVVNIFNGASMYRLITLLPTIIYLIYDLWYRLLTRKKPVHHPKKWPAGLIIYLILLQAGSIALNWYGYLVSKMHGQALVASYFVMLGFFGVYQGRYNKKIMAQP